MANYNPIEIEKVLGGISFPADKEAILNKARENGAGGGELGALEQLPEQEYGTTTDITKALGKTDENK